MPNLPPLEKPRQHKRHALAQDLRALAFTLSPGDRMPSVPELARRFGVAAGTAQAAVETLRGEGLVVRRRGSGTFVAEQRNVPGPAVPIPSPKDTATGTIAVIAESSIAYYFHCVEVLTARAAQDGLNVVCRYANHQLRQEDVFALESLDPVGFLLFSQRLSWAARTMIHERGRRAVVVGVPPAGVVPDVPSVYGDHEAGACEATRCLLEQGHRRFFYLHRLSQEHLFSSLRWHGHLRALREAGLEADAIRAVLHHDDIRSWHSDPEAVRRFFTGPNAPTAGLVWSDDEAALLLAALRAAGLCVPGDISVIGYNNLPISAQVEPMLDTMDQHLDTILTHALALLLSDRPLEPQVPVIVVTPTMIRRASSTAITGTSSSSSGAAP